MNIKVIFIYLRHIVYDKCDRVTFYQRIESELNQIDTIAQSKECSYKHTYTMKNRYVLIFESFFFFIKLHFLYYFFYIIDNSNMSFNAIFWQSCRHLIIIDDVFFLLLLIFFLFRQAFIASSLSCLPVIRRAKVKAKKKIIIYYSYVDNIRW